MIQTAEHQTIIDQTEIKQVGHNDSLYYVHHTNTDM